MKSPLRYQITDFDCGSVSLINCVSYLFEREEIPTELIKVISTYTLDCYDDRGRLGSSSINREIMFFISRWITEYAVQRMIPLMCKYVRGYGVNILMIKKVIMAGGCVNLRTYRAGESHYVMITGMDSESVYIFDPYYKDMSLNESIKVDNTKPFTYNRKVKLEYFLMASKNELALGPEADREAIYFCRNDEILEMASE